MPKIHLDTDISGDMDVRQAEVCARSWQNEQQIGAACPALPRDIINFQHDPLACAIALGWREGVKIDTMPLKIEARDGWLYETPDPGGIPTRVVTQIDGSAFNAFWCEVLCGEWPSPRPNFVGGPCPIESDGRGGAAGLVPVRNLPGSGADRHWDREFFGPVFFPLQNRAQQRRFPTPPFPLRLSPSPPGGEGVGG